MNEAIKKLVDDFESLQQPSIERWKIENLVQLAYLIGQKDALLEELSRVRAEG